MDFKKLEKAQKIFVEIQKVDKEIIKIEKLAKIIIDGGNTDFIFRVTAPTPDKKVNVLDSDGSLTISEETSPRYFGGIFSFDVRPSITVVVTSENEIKETLEESISLQVLGVLLAEKSSARKSLITKLEKLGITV